MSSANLNRNSASNHYGIGEQGEPSWIFPAVAAPSLFFISLLLLAMIFDPSVRILHPFQALIYVAIIYLARRHSAWGFGAGCIIAVFWNYIFLTAAAKDIWAFFTSGTGGIFVPLQLAAVAAHLVLIAACFAGACALRPGGKEWAKFLGGGVAAVSVLVLLIYFLRPESMVLLRRSFGF